MERELDLAFYLNPLRRRAKLITGIIILVLAFSLTSTFLQRPSFEAESSLLVMRSRTEVNLRSNVRSALEPAAGTTGSGPDLTTIITLMSSPALESMAMERLDPSVAQDERKVGTLLKGVVSVASSGSLIRITAVSSDAETAQRIADVWAEVSEEYINRIYVQPSAALAVIGKEVAEAKKTYDLAAKAVNDFVRSNNIDELTREINRKQNYLGYYDGLYNKLESVLADAEALRGQIRNGTASQSGATANSLSLLFIRASAFTFSSTFPAQLQIPVDQIASTSATNFRQDVDDLDQLILVLRQRRQEARAFADDPKLNDEIASLQAQMAAENVEMQDLNRASELAWEAYTALSRKATELKYSSDGTGTEVKLAYKSQGAVVKESSNPSSLGSAAVLGLVLGVFGAYTLEFAARIRKQRS